MKRIYEDRAYTGAPVQNNYWTQQTGQTEQAALAGAQTAEMAIVGAGFTGLTAALHLAEDGVDVAVLDAQTTAWGASTRNGGFCCLGGGLLDNAALDTLYGPDERKLWRTTEREAVQHVSALLARLDIDADTHSHGETVLAHKPARWETLRRHADQVHEDYGVSPHVTQRPADDGMGGPFCGALTIPIGFGLDPAKYARGLAQAALDKGARLFTNSPVIRITAQRAGGYLLTTPNGTVTARKILIATNGYSSDDLPDWLHARYMPVQSSVLVTRPLTDAELGSAGWTSDQMCYDTRNLLHYFRLMPNRRFLFGMRGGVFSTKRADTRTARRIRRDFNAMFPAWAHVETPHIWSGFVSLSRKGLPFAGAIPDMPSAFASLNYHGNGVAMASYCGTLMADLMQGKSPRMPHPECLKAAPNKIPLGRKRRWILPPLYAAMSIVDR